MAITTNDLLTAALANARQVHFQKNAVTAKAVGRFFSFWLTAGMPGAGATPASGLNGQAVNNTFAGVFPFTDPAGGNTGYAAKLSAAGATAGRIIVYDRLWQNSGIAVATTTAQAITPAALPARDENGATNGDGVSAWLECYAATTNAGAISNTTISYTNSAGVAGRTGTIMPDWPATAVLGHLSQFSLQSGDTGVRSIQSITLGTSYVTGTVGLVLHRDIASVDVTAPGFGDFRNFYDLGRKLYAGSALCLKSLVSATAFGIFMGEFQQIEG